MTIDNKAFEDALDQVLVHCNARQRWRVIWSPSGEVLEELEAGATEAQARAAAVLWATKKAREK